MHGVRSWDVGRCRRNGDPLVLEIVDWPSGASGDSRRYDSHDVKVSMKKERNYGHEIEMYTVEQGEKRDKRQ